MKFDPQKHHHRSIRLKEYDYTAPGAYFITLVSWQRENIFGEILDGGIKLNQFGQIAKQQWEKLPRRFRHIELDEFVIMPNHVHGIIVISADRMGTAGDVYNNEAESSRRADCMGTAGDVYNNKAESSCRAPSERFGQPVSGSIPTIVRSYKSSVSYRINLMRGTRGDPIWQRNYYEHIVRDVREWNRINQYIIDNPFNWRDDDENPGKEFLP